MKRGYSLRLSAGAAVSVLCACGDGGPTLQLTHARPGAAICA